MRLGDAGSPRGEEGFPVGGKPVHVHSDRFEASDRESRHDSLQHHRSESGSYLGEDDIVRSMIVTGASEDKSRTDTMTNLNSFKA